MSWLDPKGAGGQVQVQDQVFCHTIFPNILSAALQEIKWPCLFYSKVIHVLFFKLRPGNEDKR